MKRIRVPKRKKHIKHIQMPKTITLDKTISIILRYCNKSQYRYRNLKILINNLKRLQNAEIILSIMDDKQPKLEDISNQIIKIYNPEPFESSKANNIGANAAKTNILIFQDADIIFDNIYYQQIIDKINKGYESIRVGQTCVNLGELITHQISTGETDLDKLLSKHTNDSIRDAPGGCSAITREAFIRIGGFCELFQKYGWEDCYYRTKLHKLTKHTDLKACMYHLWHEENYQAGYQAENAHLYNEILTKDNGNCEWCSQRDKKHLTTHYENLKHDTPTMANSPPTTIHQNT